ncbi:hypothetical protein U1707_08435 [Sphingomonas sp. PB2P12]|uniref:hypothetical protein n=1 Tax=Sphingomonas sandaracina TaxID=3096157 RepID=UPI002FCA9E33
MTPTIGDNLVEVVRMREAFVSPDNTGDREEQAREILSILLAVAGKLAGPEVLAAAYGAIEPGDRVSTLRAIVGRARAVAPLFARLPEDGASFYAIAAEALAITGGDDPLLFARLPDLRKNPLRLARAKLSALLWDAYLKAMGIAPPERHGAIASSYGQEWDTVERWSKQVRQKLGVKFVKYHTNVATIEGANGQRFSWSDRTPYGSEPPTLPWQEHLKDAGRDYKAAMNANAGR